MIKTAPHSTLSPQMCCIKNKMVCTHPDLLARICKLVERKKFGLICFPRLIYCDQEPLLLLNLTVHLFGCTYKAISTRYKICFTPKSLHFSMGASLLAVAKSTYYLLQLTSSHLLLVNVPLFPLSLASAQVIKEKKNISLIVLSGLLY